MPPTSRTRPSASSTWSEQNRSPLLLPARRRLGRERPSSGGASGAPWCVRAAVDRLRAPTTRLPAAQVEHPALVVRRAAPILERRCGDVDVLLGLEGVPVENPAVGQGDDALTFRPACRSRVPVGACTHDSPGSWNGALNAPVRARGSAAAEAGPPVADTATATSDTATASARVRRLTAHLFDWRDRTSGVAGRG